MGNKPFNHKDKFSNLHIHPPKLPALWWPTKDLPVTIPYIHYSLVIDGVQEKPPTNPPTGSSDTDEDNQPIRRKWIN